MRFKKILSLFMTIIMVLTLLPVSAFAADSSDPELTKTAEWIPGENGLAKITLKTKGTPIDTTIGADVVMVLDASGSMDYIAVEAEPWEDYGVVDRHFDPQNSKLYLTVVLYTAKGHQSEPYNLEMIKERGRWRYTDDSEKKLEDLEYKLNYTKYKERKTRWEIATDAVEALAKQVIPDTSSDNNLGLVVFSSKGYNQNKECDLTKNSATILGEIPREPEGGTDYTSALQRAYDMLGRRTNKSRPAYVVFLTDGAPGLKGKSGNDPDWNGEKQIADLKKADVTIYTVGFNLTDWNATNRLERYATTSGHYENISDANELSGLLSDIGSTIASGVTIQDSIDTRYFTIAKKPDGSNYIDYENGNVLCTNDKDITWSLDNFSPHGDTLEIYVQLKDEYMNTNEHYPTNEEGSAYGKYVGPDGNKVDLPVSTTNGSSPVPQLNVKAKKVKVNFQFVGPNKDKVSFNDESQSTQSIEVGNKVTKPGVTVSDGYKISDWYPTADCTGTAFDFNSAITENNTVNLFARVDEDRDVKYTYTVDFYKNGIKSETVPGSVWAGEPSITVANAKSMKTGNYTNYSFTEAKVGANAYTQDTDKISVGKNGNTVIEVYFTAGTVELSFQRGDHGKFSAVADKDKTTVTRTARYDANFNDAPSIEPEQGWNSVGWYEAGDAEKKIVNFPQKITAAKTYVMKYEKDVAAWKSVTFLKNDGTSAQHKVVDEILVGNSVSSEVWPANPVRAGYEFTGWFTKDGTNGDWGNQFSQSSKVNDNLSVYAKWQKKITDVPVDYYLGSIGGKKLTFTETQKISSATIGAAYTEYINDALKGKGNDATNQDSEKVYYEISKEKAVVYINGEVFGTQTVKDGDVIQVVYPAKTGRFKVWEFFLANDPSNNYGQYLNEYEASLSHGSDLKYGAEKTDINITEINKILKSSLEETQKSNPGAKLKSVYIDYQKINANGEKKWQAPIVAKLNAAGTAVETFNGLDQMSIHGGCETRLTFNYELPVEVRVEYYKQYGDTNKYYNIDGKDYVVGGGTSYVYKSDKLDIVENANSLNTINKVVPSGVEGYQVARVATKDAPATTITSSKYEITKPTTFIVFLDAITTGGGKIVNVDNAGATLEGAEFVFNEAILAPNSTNKNEYPIIQNFVYGVEYTVEQTKSALGYEKSPDFKVRLKSDGSGLELVGTVQNVTVNGMTITVVNQIDTNQVFDYTVNRYIKGTTEPVPGLTLDELKGKAPLGNFTWTNVTETATGYKLVANPVQPTSMKITTDATKNTVNVYYEVDDSQTRGYKITYWKDGESQPFSTTDSLTVLEADPWVAYEDVPKIPKENNIPKGYEFKGIEFAGKEFNSDKIQITTTDDNNEIKVIYKKQDGMWFDVKFLAGDHGKLNGNQDKVEWLQAFKDTSVADLGGIPTAIAATGYEFIGWSTDGGATLIQTEDLPKTINQSATYIAQWTKIYQMKYFVYEKKNGSDTTSTAKFNTDAEAAAAVAAHITHNSAQYSSGFFANESKISNRNLSKFEQSTDPDTKDRTETADAKFADLIRNYKDTLDLNAEYAKAPGYNVVPFRLVLEGDLVHVDCYLVKNAEDWTTITFKPGDNGKWADGTTNDVVVDAIKGAKWSDYASKVPAKPVQSEIGWKLADETQIWNQSLPEGTSEIPDNGLTFTAVWVADNATVSFEIVGDKHGVETPEDVTVQKGKTTTPPTVKVEEGYMLDGWYTDKDCNNKFDFSSTIASDTPLYAKVVKNAEDWTTITFSPGAHGKWADGTTNDVVVDAIKGVELSSYATQVPEKPLQNEIGWKLADEIQIWDQALPSEVPDDESIFTAVWVADNATVSFEIVGDKHGAENPTDVTVQKGKTTTPPTVKVEKGYMLDGWYTDGECNNKFDFSSTIAGDTPLYAKVVKNPEEWTTITFSPGDHGKWTDETTPTPVVIDAIKGVSWSNYASQVPTKPVQSEIGWKLADETQIWDQPLPSVVPDEESTFTAVWVGDNATVSFEILGDKHGTENPTDVTVQKGKTTTPPTVTVVKGYVLDGWYTDVECEIEFNFGNTITDNTKLYAKVIKNPEEWTTITFNPGDHGKWTDETTPTPVVIDAIKGAEWFNYQDQVPQKPVQSEIGWKLADETQIWDQPLPSVVPDGDVVYSAVWIEDMADVSFQLKGIDVEGTEQFYGVIKPDNQSIQKGKTAVDPTATATANIQPGYKFEGWYTDEACTELFNFSSTISGDTPLYAKVSIKEEDWAKVTFKAEANGKLNAGADDVDMVVTDPILLGNTIGRAIPTAKANAGYEFDAWYKVTESDSGIEKVTEEQIENTEVQSNLTYLAKFANLLKVTFLVNTSKAVDGTQSIYERTGISKGTAWSSIEVPTIEGKLREKVYSHDYEFVDWDIDFPGTVTSDLTFKAQFDDIYTFVVEHADLNAPPKEEQRVYLKKKAGEAISSHANDPGRGYELTNITVYVGEDKQEVATTAELIQKLKDDYNITLTEDGTLSGSMPNDCMWIKYGYEKLAERTVEYVSEGNVTGMPENLTDRYIGDEIEVSTVVPQRNGFDFGGWEVIDEVVTIENGKFTMPDKDVKLKAVWTPNEEVWTYTIEHYLENTTTPFSTAVGSVLKREPNIESVVLNAPQGYKLKEYQLNGDTTDLPVTIGEDGNVIRVMYEKNDLIVKHVYGDTTVYDTAQSKANVEDGSVVVNAVRSGRYTRVTAVTVNGVNVDPSFSVALDFTETNKYEVVFNYKRRSSDSGDPTNPGGTTGGGSTGGGDDFGETVTIVDEEVPLADGLNMIDHFAYIFGYEDDTVRPMNRISREEVAAIFYRLLNDAVRESLKTTEHNFPDISGQRWSNKSIATLTNGEILAGYPNGQFRPANSITRAEFAVIVSKFDSLSKTETNMFNDIDNHWAKDFINSAALKGWISGYPDGTFHPDDYITRAEAMTLINSVLNRKVSKDGLLENAKYWTDNHADAWYYEAVMEATNSHDYTRETVDGAETWTAMKPNKVWD